MTLFCAKINKKLKMLLNMVPTKLPIGLKEFDEYCVSIFKTYDLPDLPSYRNAIATMIMHIPPTVFYKPKHFFGVSVKKAMANQTAYEIIQQIREDEKKKEEEAKLELAVQPIEGSASSVSVSN